MAKKIRKKRSSKVKLNILDQWVEVTTKGGVTRTELFPSNEVLRDEGNQMDPPPLIVYRRINFPAGVPSEYAWTQPDLQTKRYGGGCVQRMTLPTWLETIAREARQPDGHIGPTGRPPVPRPLERGGCDCPTCTAHHHILGELGLAT